MVARNTIVFLGKGANPTHFYSKWGKWLVSLNLIGSIFNILPLYAEGNYQKAPQ